jgi:hypothetical protein
MTRTGFVIVGAIIVITALVLMFKGGASNELPGNAMNSSSGSQPSSSQSSQTSSQETGGSTSSAGGEAASSGAEAAEVAAV